jgi:hypothetical protein
VRFDHTSQRHSMPTAPLHKPVTFFRITESGVDAIVVHYRREGHRRAIKRRPSAEHNWGIPNARGTVRPHSAAYATAWDN